MTTLFAGAIGREAHAYMDLLSAFMEFGNGDMSRLYGDTECLNSDCALLLARSTLSAQAIHCDSNSGVKIIGWSRIDNRDDVALQIGVSVGRSLSDNALIALAYQYWGDDIAEKLIGDFAFVLYDESKKLCILVRDQLGVRPLYYHQINETLVFANSLAVFRQIRRAQSGLNKEWLCRYLLMNSADHRLTPYADVYSVESAHYAIFKNEKIELKRYFQFNPDTPQTSISTSSLIEAYQHHLKQAVECRASEDLEIGVELSGGLDSTSVAVIAADKLRNKQSDINAFGYAGFEHEASFIMETVNHSALTSAHLLPMDLGAGLEYENQHNRIDSVLASPVGYIDAETFIPLYQMAQSTGINALLSGFGGNEAVTSSGSLALHELFKNGQYAQWFDRLGQSPVRKIRNAVGWYRRHLMGNLVVHPTTNWQEIWKFRLVKDSLCENFGLSHPYNSNLTLKPILYNQQTCDSLTHPGLTQRLENCSAAAASFGLEYRWPLLDIRLLNFFLSVPANEKFGPGGVSRYLHRRAVSNKIPKSIAWHKAVNGMGRRFDGFERRPTVELIDYDQLAQIVQEIVDPDKLRSIQSIYLESPEKNRAIPYLRTLNRLNRWCGIQEAE